jgi:hypothetical protein
VSYRNLTAFLGQFQGALKNLPATRQAGFTVAVQALLYNMSFVIPTAVAGDLLDTLIPKEIKYSNLTVYEKTASMLTSIITFSSFYV